MKNKSFSLLGLTLLILSSALPARAETHWRNRALMEIETPGPFEAVLPPELITQVDGTETDLVLIGPDERPRAFELYWRDPAGEIRLTLTPSAVQLDRENMIIWEATLPQKILCRRLEISLVESSAIGKIDVEGKIAGEWRLLVRNAAVFGTPGLRQAGITLPENTYDKLRLSLTGFDRNVQKAISPIQTVTLEGKRVGRDYVTQELPLTFHQSESEGSHLVEALLPGDGLRINTLLLKTEARFQGEWQVGREIISDGTKRFEVTLTGKSTWTGPPQSVLVMETNRQWPGRTLVMKLNAADRYIGDIVSLTASVRLPRLAFSADKAGRYYAVTGQGKRVRIGEHPGNGYQPPASRIVFSVPETNPQWRMSSLVEKYHLKGGPFMPEGYTWRATVSIAEPGYYRLPLNLKASLAPRCAAIRMVKDETQIPFITGRVEDKTIELKATSTYDVTKNTSIWEIRLPQASPNWRELAVYAAGIFKRNIEIQIPKPGAGSWQTWKQSVWESRGLRETALRVPLNHPSNDLDSIRIIMPHGDNEPVTISKITAGYSSPTFYFLAHTAGDYTVYGGNPDASVPRYDLSLIQSELLSTLPVEISMGEPETFSRPGWQRYLSDAFKGKNWGLYAVLGLVTIVLLVIIFRLFPKPGDERTSGS